MKKFTFELWNQFHGINRPRLTIGSVVELSDQYTGGTDHRKALILGYEYVQGVADLTVNGENFNEYDLHETYTVTLFDGSNDPDEKSQLWPDEVKHET